MLVSLAGSFSTHVVIVESLLFNSYPLHNHALCLFWEVHSDISSPDLLVTEVPTLFLPSSWPLVKPSPTAQESLYLYNTIGHLCLEAKWIKDTHGSKSCPWGNFFLYYSLGILLNRAPMLQPCSFELVLVFCIMLFAYPTAILYSFLAKTKPHIV